MMMMTMMMVMMMMMMMMMTMTIVEHAVVREKVTMMMTVWNDGNVLEPELGREDDLFLSLVLNLRMTGQIS